MTNRQKAIGSSAFVMAALFVVAFPTGAIRAQQTDETAGRIHVTVTQADIDAAAAVRYSRFHVMAAGISRARERVAALNREHARQVAELTGRQGRPPATTPATGLAKPYFYPADLVKSGGPTVVSAVNHAVYINYTGKISAMWDDPEGYLTNLFQDPFIHLSDQYTGKTTDGRYTVGKSAMATYSEYTAFGNNPVIYEHELWAIVHAVAAGTRTTPGLGSGLGHIYHLFLPKNTDTCIDETTDCYSPDNFVTWDFCAYHDSITFKDIGLVLFTVEPYQNVDTCAVSKPSSNGELGDSTDSVLSHETFETITDPEPDPEDPAWNNQTSLDLQGYEVSDECQPLTDDNGNFLVPTFKINGKPYAVQLEYSNKYHTCAAQP
jgi:hypothetical protein